MFEIGREVRGFLGRTYNLKAIADDECGTGAGVTVEQATRAVTEGRSFVAYVAGLLDEGRTWVASTTDDVAREVNAATREPREAGGVDKSAAED